MIDEPVMDVLTAFEVAFGITPYTLMCQIYSGDVVKISIDFTKLTDADGRLSNVKTEGLLHYRPGLEKAVVKELNLETPAA